MCVCVQRRPACVWGLSSLVGELQLLLVAEKVVPGDRVVLRDSEALADSVLDFEEHVGVALPERAEVDGIVVAEFVGGLGR